MSTDFLHGFEFIEYAPYQSIQMVRSSVIGLVGVSPIGPVNTPVLIMGKPDSAQFGFDNAWSIPQALKAIFDQGDHIGFVVAVNVCDPAKHSTAVVDEAWQFGADGNITLAHKWGSSLVVKSSDGLTTYTSGTDYVFTASTGIITRVTTGVIPANASVKASYSYTDMSKVTLADIIGGVDAVTGKNTGIEALLDTSSIFGFAPKLLIAPGYSSDKTVMDELLVKADTLRAFAIADPPVGATTEVILAYRGQFDNPRAVVTYPLLQYQDTDGSDRMGPYSAYLAGVISRTDNDLGFWYSPSNKIIYGIDGLERPIPYITFHDPNSMANYLNENHIVTVIHADGYRVWGNYSATTDTAWQFIAIRRQFDIIEDSIEIGTLNLLDRPINKAFFQDLQDNVQAFLNSLLGRGAIVYGKCMIAPEDNPPTEIAAGHVTARLDIAPTYPAQRITYSVTVDVDQLALLFTQQ